MKFSIRYVILWPRSRAFQPRVVEFKPGVINVISGASRTGKSAIIPIVDWCLGSDTCAIPTNTIRKACSWFGVLVQTSEGEKLFARREPGDQRSTGDMYVLEAPEVLIPNFISEKNATVELVKGKLDELAGLTSLDFVPVNDGVAAGFNARPSFRDMMAFNFQPQNLVANPNTLFYKADTHDHQQKLRNVFPYVLGAVTADVLAKRYELDQLRRQYRRKSQELETVKTVSENFMAQLDAHIARVREFGLVPDIPDGSLSREDALALLRRAALSNKETLSSTTNARSIEGSSAQVVELRRQESELSITLAGFRQRLLEMAELRKSASDFTDSLFAQRDRLSIANWMRNKLDEDHDCPVCGHAVEIRDQLDTLVDRISEIERSSAQFQAAPATLDREYQRVREEVDRLGSKLDAVRYRLKELRLVSAEEEKRQYTELNISRYLGRLESELSVLTRIGRDSALQEEVQELARRISELERQIDPRSIRERQERAIGKISGFASRFMPMLDSEHPNSPFYISVSDLTVKVAGDGREDYLFEIGSGSNWLSYHIAATLALQCFFADQRHCPVPQFLIYDQPSQVYFPQQLTDKKREKADEDTANISEPVFEDEDVEAVSKIFRAFAEALVVTEKALQIIVLDHASARVWGDVPVNYVEEWRGGRKLVPEAWISSTEPV